MNMNLVRGAAIPLTQPPTENLYSVRTQTGKWKRLAGEQSAEQGKNSFALLGPLLQYLVVGFLFLGNNQLFIVACLLCLLFSHYRVFLPVSVVLP